MIAVSTNITAGEEENKQLHLKLTMTIASLRKVHEELRMEKERWGEFLRVPGLAFPRISLSLSLSFHL